MVLDLGPSRNASALSKDLKEYEDAELRKDELLKRANAPSRSAEALREMGMTPEDKKRLRGFMFSF